jgi:hypothetical protein
MRCFLSLFALSLPCVSALAREEPKAAAPVLEFRIVANSQDEEKALATAAKYLTDAKDELKKRAEKGEPPPTPADLKSDKAPGYSWVRLNPIHLHDFDLDDAAEKDEARGRHWRQAAAAREKGEAFVLQRTERGILIFSRKSSKPEEKFGYFVLLRNMPAEQAVTSKHIEKVTEGTDFQKNPCVNLRLNKDGGDRFHALTDASKERQLAIVYEGQVFSAPKIKAAIRNEVQITGKFTKQDIEKMISVLKAGSKPG